MTTPNDSLPTAPSGEEQTDPTYYTDPLRVCLVATWLECGADAASDRNDALQQAQYTRAARTVRALSTERARMERERDEQKELCVELSADIGELHREVSRLTSELDRVRGALRKISERREWFLRNGSVEGIGAVAWLLAGIDLPTLGVTPAATTRREG